jgi:signal peptidase I
LPAIRPSPDWYPPRRPPPAGRRLLHLFALLFSGFLLLRTVAVEPFGVPTGSMAPALLGVRRAAACPRCDFPVVVGEPGADGRPVAWERCRCPNCDQPVDLSAARVLPGDRLLVDKTAFDHRPPRRWEVAVFDGPADRAMPYVKRLVGLPGEFVRVQDGDVFADGRLCRKTLAQLREMWVPVFDPAYAPPAGWADRWLLDAAEWTDDALVLAGRERPATATYQHWHPDRRREEPVDSALGYNGGPADRRGGFARLHRPDAAHDFAVTFDLAVVGGDGVVRVGLDDGAERVWAEVPTADLPPGQPSRVEVAFADRRLSVGVNGVERAPHDRPPAADRRGTSRPLAVAAHGVDAVVRNLRLWRDVHYLPFGVAAGGWQLGPGEYFALGDNTSNSHDSRTWQVGGKPAPGVPAAGLIGKPFLIHQPTRLARLPTGGPVQSLDWGRLRLLR